MSKYYDKKIHAHEQAVHWFASQVYAMRSTFNKHAIEAGIDGVVELADPQTGAAKASFVGVQVKTCERFDAETADKFSFYVDGNDIGYWMASTIPVLLVVCRARTEEAYAIWVREYFKAPQNQGSKTVVFNKERDRFKAGDDWLRRLVEVSVPHSRGFSFPPVPMPEDISSNLIEAVLPETVFFAQPKLKLRTQVLDELRKQNFDGHEFLLRDKLLWTVHSLHESAWANVVENGTIKPMSFTGLAQHNDPAKRRYAVELLNLCLNARLRRDDVYWSDDEEMFIYSPKREVTKRVRKSVKTEDSVTRRGLIFPTYFNGRVVRCRHLAFMASFVEIGGIYYLQVDPTYYFTRDGRRKHPRWEDLIRQARILQKEQDYHSNLEVWREVLTQPADFARQEYPFLRFKDYLRFVSPVSIPDKVWNPPKSASSAANVNLDQQLSLPSR